MTRILLEDVSSKYKKKYFNLKIVYLKKQDVYERSEIEIVNKIPLKKRKMMKALNLGSF